LSARAVRIVADGTNGIDRTDEPGEADGTAEGDGTEDVAEASSGVEPAGGGPSFAETIGRWESMG
jgi:hypothetical protein